ncbi:NADP-dependent oxidoreductase domain-containing protein [Aspergillus desertorum]
MAVPPKAKTAHVNMMTDTIIGNLPLDGLRVVMRSLLSAQPSLTPIFEEQTRTYIHDSAFKCENLVVLTEQADGFFTTTEQFQPLRSRICCMVGCGLCYQALELLRGIVNQAAQVKLEKAEDGLMKAVAAVDGDIVQALTAIQKTLLSPDGVRKLTDDEARPIEELYQSLVECRGLWEEKGQAFGFERGLDATASLLDPSTKSSKTAARERLPFELPPSTPSETFTLNGVALTRIFTGLWQLSSPAWGSASRSKIMDRFSDYVHRGFTAFDMADHYGDAEIIFGRYRASSAYSDAMFAATKYCIFHPMTMTEEAVRANITERCRRLNTDKLDLLQFHWQDYNDPQYIQALHYLQSDPRVSNLGLCNFDTEHMQNVLDAGIKIATNQVQFSLIDTRPINMMLPLAKTHGIKLLTYGTLCGGLLSEKYLNRPPPDLYSPDTTPSIRKYYAMIRVWGGWELFQELLSVLKVIGEKHGVSISNVAARWVLDFEGVGAVIVGWRGAKAEGKGADVGEGSLGALVYRLDEKDRGMIEGVLERSNRQEIFGSMGDCGGEYR